MPGVGDAGQEKFAKFWNELGQRLENNLLNNFEFLVI